MAADCKSVPFGESRFNPYPIHHATLAQLVERCVLVSSNLASSAIYTQPRAIALPRNAVTNLGFLGERFRNQAVSKTVGPSSMLGSPATEGWQSGNAAGC